MFNNSIEPQKINKKFINRAVPLSTAHIRPFSGSECNNMANIVYIRGASLLRCNKNRPCEAKGGGPRGGIKGFSKNSRKRLLELIAGVKRDAELPDFVTLTYPANFPTVGRAKRDLKVFLQRLDRQFSNSGLIWKLEPQERGAPHYHLLVWGCETAVLLDWVVNNWYEIAGDGDRNHYLFHAGLLTGSTPCVNKVRSFRGVWSYAAKYLGKTFEVAEWGAMWTGRFWGVVRRQNIPFGETITIQSSYSMVCEVMRYQRRFMNMRNSKDLNSLKSFCDADQWIQRIVRPARE